MGEHDLFDAPSEEPVDLRRYLEALRRRARLIAGLSVGIALLVLIFSELLPKTYTATAQIAPSTSALSSGSALGSGAAASSSSAAQNLATVQAYVTSPPVLSEVARPLHTTPDALLSQISTSVEPTANIVDVSATSSDPRRAANIATTTAQTFLSVRAATEQAQLAQQAAALTQRAKAAQASAATGLASALEQQISSIAALEAGAGSDLQLLAPAAVPGSATSPRPTRNALFALIAVLFLSALAVAGKEMIAPSVSGGRELSAVTGLPILGRIPRVSGPRRPHPAESPPAESEAYRFLAKSLELESWSGRPRVVAVTSAGRQEGKTTVVSRLGAALAETGSKTLLVSADLHWPALHEEFGMTIGTGLSNMLGSLNGRNTGTQPRAIKRVKTGLYMLTSGRPPADPTAVLTKNTVEAVVERMRQLDWDYVLFDLPPLLAVAETQLFVHEADAAVLVSFAGRTTTEQLSQTRELLDRLGVRPAGVVLLGVRGDDSPPYARRFRVAHGSGEGE
ncbi:MAG: Wzz/FepE/Etk N-terminal domain-containing protein [Solirubrobacteraceae bacterium]